MAFFITHNVHCLKRLKAEIKTERWRKDGTGTAERKIRGREGMRETWDNLSPRYNQEGFAEHIHKRTRRTELQEMGKSLTVRLTV